jgi:ATP-dependent Clp protease ATP-binding subunit ClpA
MSLQDNETTLATTRTDQNSDPGQFGRDLTDLARQDKLDPVVGRNNE